MKFHLNGRLLCRNQLLRPANKDFNQNAHRPRSEIKYQQKTDSGEVLNLSLSKDHKTTLTFCQVIILLYTMSQAHKVVHTSLNSISGQHSASFHNVIKMLLIYFSQNGYFWNGVLSVSHAVLGES